MAWPDDRDLPIEVEAAFGADVAAAPDTWSWTDLSARRRAVPIRLRAGRSGGARAVSPGTCTVTLDNDDSALTPLHPISPHWPNVELGTPLRVRLRHAEDGFARTVASGWGTADSGQAWSVSGAAGADFSVSGGAARHSHSTVGGLRTSTLAVALADSEQTVDVATSALLTGAALVTGLVARYASGGGAYYWLRAEMKAGGTGVMLKITRYTTAGGYVDLAVLDPVAGVTYAANTYLRVRASVVGTSLAMKVWPAAGVEPSGWQLTATDDQVTAAGRTGVQSWLVGGNTNTLPVVALHHNYALRVDRFSGFADQWEPTYLPTGVVGEMSSAVRVTCSGILRRFQQGTQLASSSLRRTIAAAGPLAYYPIEDGVAATQAGSSLAGTSPLTVTGPVEFRPVDDYQAFVSTTVRYGTLALADLAAGGRLDVTLPATVAAATTTRWTVHVAARVDVTTTSADVILMEWATPAATFVRWQLVSTTLSHTQIIGYSATGPATTIMDLASVVAGFTLHCVTAYQDGSNITVDLARGGESIWSIGVAGTLAGITSISLNPGRATSSIDMPFGHLAVFATDHVPYRIFADGPVRDALRSYAEEPAHTRLARIVAEDGIALNMPTVPDDAIQRMGWQEPGTPLELYQECVDVDGGLLHERGFGLGYLPRTGRYNLPTSLTVDLATYAVTDSPEVLGPVYDDQDIRNRWTVDRRDGSFAVAEDVASQRRGVYNDSAELALAYDTQLPDQAGWRLHLTTVVDLREATVPLDLAANPELVDGWLSCGVGSRFVRTNPPAQHRPGPIDRLVEGWTETIGPRSWQVQIVPAPAEPWDVAVADGAQRSPADGSTLAADITATATTISLTSTAANGPWTTDPADMPLDIRLGGERVTVSAIAGTTSPQTATVSARAVNGAVRSWPAGTPVGMWAPAITPL
ncbi:hypothetical protein [Micromonospora rubida]